MLILGAVLEIHEYVAVMSLPFNMRGTVAISDISDHVTKLVESEAQRLDTTQDDDTEEEVNLLFFTKRHQSQLLLLLSCRIPGHQKFL